MLFLRDYPEYMTGLILIGLARCIAMVLVWNQLAKGDAQYVAGLVAFNSVFQIALFSLYAWFFLACLPPVFGLQGSVIDVGFWTIAQAVLIYLGIPFLAGFLTSRWLKARKGERWYQENFLPASADNPYRIAVHYRGDVQSEGRRRAANSDGRSPHRDSADAVLHRPVRHQLLHGQADRQRYPRTTAIAFTAAGNNFELAIAVAIAAFGLASPVAFAAVIGPLVEVPVLILLVHVALRLGKRYFPADARSR